MELFRPETVSPGTLIDDRYRVTTVEHRSATIVVCAAQHLVLSRNVTLELLVTSSPNGRRRFKRAARLVCQLRHPNVIDAYDAGVVSGFPYFVTEYLGGQSLLERSAMRGAMPISEVLPMAQQILSALDYVHQRRIVHRDVSAEAMVFVSESDREILKLTRFTWSKTTDDESITTATSSQQELIAGFCHVAPEQIIAPDTADHRVDLYAVGVVLYQLLTGVLPFPNGTLQNLSKDIINKMPQPPHAVIPEIPPKVSAVVLRALSKKPDERFDTAGVMWDALSEAAAPFLRS